MTTVGYLFVTPRAPLILRGGTGLSPLRHVLAKARIRGTKGGYDAWNGTTLNGYFDIPLKVRGTKGGYAAWNCTPLRGRTTKCSQLIKQ